MHKVGRQGERGEEGKMRENVDLTCFYWTMCSHPLMWHLCRNFFSLETYRVLLRQVHYGEAETNHFMTTVPIPTNYFLPSMHRF